MPVQAFRQQQAAAGHKLDLSVHNGGDIYGGGGDFCAADYGISAEEEWWAGIGAGGGGYARCGRGGEHSGEGGGLNLDVVCKHP